ncbi:hypothetical protein NQ317_001536 [Molorchus minor]|uniref:DNA-directed DNA polymerase n=1 Tax=Molorchus minor TaxID=1323400 RepID=A0ABQ9JNY3_9CUCU|nr:hypothetical protein NQ317_001536 [Molorchus minor]
MEIYKGRDASSKFILSLVEDIRNIYNNIIKNPKVMQPLNTDEKNYLNNVRECYICNKNLGDDRVLDHCHLTGKFRGVVHNKCNLLYRLPKFFPIFLHNFSGYDCHLFVKALNIIEGKINLIPQNKELYISLSKWIPINDEEFIELRFLDSIRFMQSNNEQFNLVTRKGVLPYEYLNSWERLDETMLPSQIEFNSKLTNKACSDDDYQHAKRVWETFKCVNLWDYLRIYLMTDVLLLTDIFQNFRKVCYKIYSLDPAQYYTAPGLAWDAMLKYTDIKLELLTDISMYSFIKKGIRGGITQCSHRHSVANNKYMNTENYNKTDLSKYLMYLDVNNLYGWAMSQMLPYGGFKWVEHIEHVDIMGIAESSSVGYIFEVDLEYPKELHDYHNDLPFCAENKLSINSKIPKLIPDLTNKNKYVIHYRNLQQCLKFGLKLVKIHRALQFNQSCWLKKYIDLNTYHRSRAKNEFEKNYFKLKNNAVYGKTMENVDKRKDVRIVTQWDNSGRRLGARSLIAKPNFHSATQFTTDLVAIQLNRIYTCYNKPIYLGFVILELSKWLMYNFHYEYMKPKYDKNLILNYMDTDSFIYTIQTEDFYNDIKNDIVTHFDTSDYNPDNPYGLPLVNKKVVGLMKDENNGSIIKEFIGLRPKMYSIDVINKNQIKKAKGVKKTVVDSLSLDDYRDCLYKKRIFYGNISMLHTIYTQNINKICLSYSDDKRYIKDDGISTYAWGHYRIKKRKRIMFLYKTKHIAVTYHNYDVTDYLIV